MAHAEKLFRIISALDGDERLGHLCDLTQSQPFRSHTKSFSDDDAHMQPDTGKRN